MTHIKDINKRHINGQDSRHLYIAKKTEKIVSAIFMMTDLFGEDTQKIKRTLQEEGVTVLELVHELHAPAKFESTILLNLEKKFTYIISLLEVALHVHLVSESNASILIKEIHGCIERIQEIKTAPLSELQQETLTPASFELPAMMEPFEPESFETSIVAKSTPKNPSMSSQVQSKKVPEKIFEQNQDVRDNNDGVMSLTKLPKKTLKSQDKTKRQSEILDCLDRDKSINIQDIYDSFEGVSTKTIQRDLNELIKDSKVVREGNKRWATYRQA